MKKWIRQWLGLEVPAGVIARWQQGMIDWEKQLAEERQLSDRVEKLETAYKSTAFRVDEVRAILANWKPLKPADIPCIPQSKPVRRKAAKG